MRRRIKKGEPITENRRVIRIGHSFYLNLPPEFVILNNIRPGDKVPITCGHMLKVIPHVDRQVKPGRGNKSGQDHKIRNHNKD